MQEERAGCARLVVKSKLIGFILQEKWVKKMLREKGSKTPIDFLLYIGDEAENEPAFQYLNKLSAAQKSSRKKQKYIESSAAIYSCTIGMKTTRANYFLSTPDAVAVLFE
jgi:hypothetical protein